MCLPCSFFSLHFSIFIAQPCMQVHMYTLSTLSLSLTRIKGPHEQRFLTLLVTLTPVITKAKGLEVFLFSFVFCDKTLREKKLKGARIYSGSQLESTVVGGSGEQEPENPRPKSHMSICCSVLSPHPPHLGSESENTRQMDLLLQLM